MVLHMHYLLKDFVENLKNARLKKGLSQQGLGERVGMPQSFFREKNYGFYAICFSPGLIPF